MNPPLITLHERQWFAMTVFFGNMPTAHHSPVYVRAVRPLKTGRSLLEVEFFHANYSEGVQSKSYRFRVLHRAEAFLAGLSEDNESSARLLIFAPISHEWIATHFPKIGLPRETSIQVALMREFLPSELT